MVDCLRASCTHESHDNTQDDTDVELDALRAEIEALKASVTELETEVRIERGAFELLGRINAHFDFDIQFDVNESGFEDPSSINEVWSDAAQFLRDVSHVRTLITKPEGA